MKDLQPTKNQLMGLTYEEKIQISEWLHTQIDLERGQAVKEKAVKVGAQINSFLDKAAAITKTGAQNLREQFKQATGQNQEPKN